MRGKWPADTIPTPFPPRLQIATSRKSVQRNARVFRGGPPGGQWVHHPIFVGGYALIHMLRIIYQLLGLHGRRYGSGYLAQAQWLSSSSTCRGCSPALHLRAWSRHAHNTAAGSGHLVPYLNKTQHIAFALGLAWRSLGALLKALNALGV